MLHTIFLLYILCIAVFLMQWKNETLLRRPGKRKKITYAKRIEIPDMLQLRKSKYRERAVKWAIARFTSASATLFKEKLGAEGGKHLSELGALLSRYNLNEEENTGNGNFLRSAFVLHHHLL